MTLHTWIKVSVTAVDDETKSLADLPVFVRQIGTSDCQLQFGSCSDLTVAVSAHSLIRGVSRAVRGGGQESNRARWDEMFASSHKQKQRLKVVKSCKVLNTVIIFKSWVSFLHTFAIAFCKVFWPKWAAASTNGEVRLRTTRGKYTRRMSKVIGWEETLHHQTKVSFKFLR